MKYWLVLSNCGWLFPIALAVTETSFLWAGMATCMLVLSVLHHLTERSMWRSFDTIWEIIDAVFSLIFLACGPYLLWVSDSTTGEWIMCIIATVFSGAVYDQSRRFRRIHHTELYVVWHSLWHLSGALLTELVYLICFGWVQL
jgi:uncharacterized membrane protein YeiH